MPTNPKRVAIVHDWLLTLRGGERVLEAILELYPQAEIFTLFYRKGSLSPKIEARKIHASILNKLPWVHKYYRLLLPLFPWIIERFDLSEYDLVISSSFCVAKGALVAPHSLHVCYCHSPMRYAWDQNHEYFPGWKGWLTSPFFYFLRQWDVTSAARVDHFIANSSWIQERITKYYRRESTIITPFVNPECFVPSTGDKGDYYLVAGGFAPYKRIDLAIEACESLGRRLLIVGQGQVEGKLRSLAGKHTEFLGRVSDEELRELYAGAKALLFPGKEDFGIVPLEAMAAGTPVLAFGLGGARDSILEGQTGLFFHDQTVEALKQCILDFEESSERFSPEDCKQQASGFSRKVFQSEFQSAIEAWSLEKKKSGRSNRATPMRSDLPQ